MIEIKAKDLCYERINKWLRRELAEWVGMELRPLKEPILGYTFIPYYDGLPVSLAEVDFTHSLDACFKWLVPKAIDEIMAEQQCSSDVAYAILFKKWLQELELIIPQAALALCLAVEKLILEKETRK